VGSLVQTKGKGGRERGKIGTRGESLGKSILLEGIGREHREEIEFLQSKGIIGSSWGEKIFHVKKKMRVKVSRI